MAKSHPKILFVGDINVDLILGGLESLPVVDREITCASFDVSMGSTAVICACAYSGFGGDASFLGLAGRDDYGEFMLRGLRERGVNTDLVRRTDRVRTGVTVNLIHQNTRTQITYPGTIAAFEGGDLDQDLLSRFDHVHFAGPYLQTRFRPEIKRLLRLASTAGLTASLDPQWDPSGRWEDFAQWLPRLTFLFVNEDEARAASGRDSIEEASHWLAERTPRAIIKMGARGAGFQADGRFHQVAPVPARVVDTTGAGDCFDAAFLYAVLERGEPVAEAVRSANAAASLSCASVGGVAARSSWDEVRQHLAAAGGRG